MLFRSVVWRLEPPTGAGELKNGTYYPPMSVGEQGLRVRVSVYSKLHLSRGEKATVEIFVEPEIPGVKRNTKTTKSSNGEVIFDVMVITDEYSWACKSEAALANQVDGRSVIERFGRQGLFSGYQDVLALGTASHEGAQDEEDARADRRATKLGEWIVGALKDSVDLKSLKPAVYGINLGQIRARSTGSTESCSELTANERPLVIIGVIRRDASIDIERGLERVFRENTGEHLFEVVLKYYPPPWKLKRIGT